MVALAAGQTAHPERIMNRKGMLHFLGISESTAARWDAAGIGPPAFRRGRVVLYRESALLAWLDDNTPAASSTRGVRDSAA